MDTSVKISIIALIIAGSAGIFTLIQTYISGHQLRLYSKEMKLRNRAYLYIKVIDSRLYFKNSDLFVELKSHIYNVGLLPAFSINIDHNVILNGKILSDPEFDNMELPESSIIYPGETHFKTIGLNLSAFNNLNDKVELHHIIKYKIATNDKKYKTFESTHFFGKNLIEKLIELNKSKKEDIIIKTLPSLPGLSVKKIKAD